MPKLYPNRCGGWIPFNPAAPFVTLVTLRATIGTISPNPSVTIAR